MFGIGAGNTDVQSRQAMATRASVNICWPEISARDQAWSLDFGRWIAMPGDIEDLPRDCMVPSGGLAEAAAVSVGACSVEKHASATRTRHRRRGACCTESHTDSFNVLSWLQDRAPVPA